MKPLSNLFKKPILIFSALLFSELSGTCQEFNSVSLSEKRPVLFVGPGLGINEYGLGLSIENFLSDNLSVNGFAGIGTWGAKLGGSLNLYPSAYDHGEISLGYSYARGRKNIETELSTEPYGETRSLTLDLNHVSTINVIYSYNLDVGRGKIVLSAGYSICLTVDPYTIKDPVMLDKFSSKVMNFIQPGGFILGYKIMIGL